MSEVMQMSRVRVGEIELSVDSDGDMWIEGGGNLWVEGDEYSQVLTPKQALRLAKWIMEVYADE